MKYITLFLLLAGCAAPHPRVNQLLDMVNHDIAIAKQREASRTLAPFSIGATEDAVRRSIGAPEVINTSAYGPAQWVYRYYGGESRYLYFRDGVLVNWQISQ